MASESAELGLSFDLDLWRRGIRNAQRVTKSGLGPDALNPFERGMKRVLDNVRKQMNSLSKSVGGGIAGFSRQLFNIRNLVVGLAAGKLVRDLLNARDVAREFADSMERVRGAGGRDIPGLEQFSRGLSSGAGVSQTDLNNTLSRFLAGGFEEQQAKSLTSLSADVAAQFGINLESASKKVLEAALGRVESLREIGIDIEASGSRTRDALAAITRLQELTAGAAARLTNPSARMDATLERIQRRIGDFILPKMDNMLVSVDALLTKWEAVGMDENLRLVAQSLETFKDVIDRLLNSVTGNFTRFLSSYEAFRDFGGLFSGDPNRRTFAELNPDLDTRNLFEKGFDFLTNLRLPTQREADAALAEALGIVTGRGRTDFEEALDAAVKGARRDVEEGRQIIESERRAAEAEGPSSAPPRSLVSQQAIEADRRKAEEEARKESERLMKEMLQQALRHGAQVPKIVFQHDSRDPVRMRDVSPRVRN